MYGTMPDPSHSTSPAGPRTAKETDLLIVAAELVCSSWCGRDRRAATTGGRPSAEGAEPPSKMSLRVWGFSGGEGDSKHPLPLSGPLHTFPPWGKYAIGDKPRRSAEQLQIVCSAEDSPVLSFGTTKKSRSMAGARKTVNRHNSMYCCACSCMFVQNMMVCTQLNKLEFI